MVTLPPEFLRCPGVFLCLALFMGGAACVGPGGVPPPKRGPPLKPLPAIGPHRRALQEVRFPEGLARPDENKEREIVEAVVQLWSSDLREYADAARRLVDAGPTAVPYLGHFGDAEKELQPGYRVRPADLVLPRILRRLDADGLSGAFRSPYAAVRASAAAVAADRPPGAVAAPLVVLLEDPELRVRRRAIATLRRISLEFHGYRPTDAPSDRKDAIERWRRWRDFELAKRRALAEGTEDPGSTEAPEE